MEGLLIWFALGFVFHWMIFFLEKPESYQNCYYARWLGWSNCKLTHPFMFKIFFVLVLIGPLSGVVFLRLLYTKD